MRNGRRTSAAFTLAELLVVIVIIGILAAFLLPAVMRGRQGAQVAEAKSRISGLTLALDSFYNAFGYYPPTTRAWNPATQGWDHPDAYGDYAYNEALVHCLTSKFVKGVGDEGAANDLTQIKGMIAGALRIPRQVGKAPVGIGPLLEVKASDLTDRDNDGWPELIDPWDNPYIYIPKSDYLQADGTYRAGALAPVDYDGNGEADPVDPTWAGTPPNEHYQRFKFQLISLGPDGWTPGLNPAAPKYAHLTIVDHPFAGGVNPALVGTDTDMSAPVIDAAKGHPDGTADDISNLK